MTMAAIIVYSLPQVLQITLDGVNSRETRMIVSSHHSQSKIRVFRNTTTPIDFLVKDVDRRAVNAGALRLVVWLPAALNMTPSVLEKNLIEVNAAKGHYRVTISEEESNSFALGDYSWAVTRTVDGAKTLLFTDHGYGAKASFQVIDGIPPVTPPAHTILPSDFTPDQFGDYSSAIPANIPSYGQHSVVLSLVSFTGYVVVEGSMEPSAPTNEGWVEVKKELYTNASGNIHLHFEGNFTFTRFRVFTSTGIEKITYRN